MKRFVIIFVVVLSISGVFLVRNCLAAAEAEKAEAASISRKLIAAYIPEKRKYETPRVKLRIEERYLSQASWRSWAPYEFAINYKTLQPSDDDHATNKDSVHVRIFPSFNEFIDGQIRIEENWIDPSLSITKFPDENHYLFGLNFRKRCMNGERCTKYHSLFLKDQKPYDFYIFCPDHVEPKFCNMFMIWHARSEGRRAPAIAVKVSLDLRRISEWADIEKAVRQLLYDKVSLVDE